MLDREATLKIIHDIYDARLRDDNAGLSTHLAPEARFCLGTHALLPEEFRGPADARAAVAALIDLFEFHSVELLDAVVEWPRAATRWRFRLSPRGLAPVETEALDLWRFSEDGQVESLVQFIDTGLMRSMLP